MGGQFGVAEPLAAAVLADGDQCRMVVAAAQQLFGEVQRGAGEPVGAGHRRAFFQYRAGRTAEAHLEEVDDGLPERGSLGDAPGVQGRVVGQGEGMALVDEAAERLQAGGGDAFGGRAPEGLGHAEIPGLLIADHCR
ncbi:hypothetical protein D9M70_474870 [compost metagenome]